MFDVALTDTGDIDFIMSEGFPRCCVSFMIAKYRSQRVNFITIPLKQPKKKPSVQRVQFDYVPQDLISLSSNVLENTDEAIQAIKLQLRTEAGDVKNDVLGTQFYQFKHNVIRRAEDLEPIRKLAEEIVHNILPEAEVKVSFEVGAGYFYCQNVRVQISLHDNFVADFVL